ncbi:hypothetical protein CPB83DRAFT_853075 [Crepidotus variabilis]|uniref:Shelterin complex subunit TPP1/Est3 domain-containing protein n=1 Tax=Crepidotus variabilis TaxID=179855 RepID=A0A9P6JR92_9AGAR|nr:hypothetical protein CPB83DRAFT_853075 [Crepidotus variabilis]
MTDSLSPWMAAYLIGIAESFGAKYYDAPRHERPKKVQIVEFLTYPMDEQETAIWGRVSDKKHLVVVKFSADAVKDFNQCSSTRFTQNKGALIKISKFKPLFSKYPIGKDRMSTASAMCLDCQHVSLLGAASEPTFGKPTDVHQNSEIQAWSRGLAKDGGAGNILKERKEERDIEPASVKPLSQMAPPTPVIPIVAKVVERPRVQDVDWNSYAKQWKAFEAFMGPDGVVPALSRDEEKPVSKLTQGSSLHPRSDSVVEGSRSSPQMSKKGASEKQVSSQEGLRTSSQSLTAPTPAQRTKPINSHTPDQPFSSLPSLDETQVSPTRRIDMSRKVPRPVSPEPAREIIGPARVLVANSDIASQPTQLSQGMPETVVPWMKTSEILDILRSTTRHRLHNSEHT